MKTIADVVREMQAGGWRPIFAETQLGTTPTRVARALKATGHPVHIRKAKGGGATGVGRRAQLSLWTTVEGCEVARIVAKATELLARSHNVAPDRFALARVAEAIHAVPGLLAELRAAYNLDAPENTLEMMLWPIRETVLRTTKEPTP